MGRLASTVKDVLTAEGRDRLGAVVEFIEKLLSRLRSKLEAAGITIRTVRGLGYYLEKPDDADPQHH